MPQLLLVEDNPGIQLANRDMLTLLGYEVVTAMSLADARSHISKEMPDAILLDIMLPDGSGLDFLAELRRFSSVPVLILTALDTAEDTVLGLSAGADDYLSKPYTYAVLAARVEALLRRSVKIPQLLYKGPLTFDLLSGQAFLHGHDMLLTQKEFSVLLLLRVQKEGHALSAQSLYETVWHQPFAGDSQALRSTILRLRGKLAPSGYDIALLPRKGYILQTKP